MLERQHLLGLGARGGLAASVLAFRLSLGDADPLALEHDLALECRDSSEQSQHQLAGGGGGVQAKVADAQGRLTGLDDTSHLERNRRLTGTLRVG
jgi:hypothetical protein